jgi:hypothetical protein
MLVKLVLCGKTKLGVCLLTISMICWSDLLESQPNIVLSCLKKTSVSVFEQGSVQHVSAPTPETARDSKTRKRKEELD